MSAAAVVLPPTSTVRVQEIRGDLLQAPYNHNVQLIVQQLNCLAVHPHGLSETIAKTWSYANEYGRRRKQGNLNLAVAADRAVPGSICVSDPTQTDEWRMVREVLDPLLPINLAEIVCKYVVTAPIVVGIYGQYQMGKPLKYDYTHYMNADIANGYKLPAPDNAQNREGWFRQGLSELADVIAVRQIASVAFPHKIGCGLAGGNWSTYERMIKVDFVQMLQQQSVHDVTVFIVEMEEEAPAPAPAAVKRQAPDAGSYIEVMMTGSRNWTHPVDSFMLDMVARHAEFADVNAQIRLHHGNARGADTLCDSFAKRRGWTVKRYLPDWDGWRRRGNVAAAGVVRNAEMVNESRPEYVVGFVQPVSRGTWHALKCIQTYAAEADTRLKEVTIVSEDACKAVTSQVYSREQFLTAKLG